MEGVIIGFDEYMNLVLDESEEVNLKNGNRKQVGKCLFIHSLITRSLGELHSLTLNCFTGRILLKGDNITLIQTSNSG